jgi:hypothetical protein
LEKELQFHGLVEIVISPRFRLLVPRRKGVWSKETPTNLTSHVPDCELTTLDLKIWIMPLINL